MIYLQSSELAARLLGECHLTAEQKAELTRKLAKRIQEAVEHEAAEFIAEERLPK